MPRIPLYTRKESVPGVGGNVPMNNSGITAAREMGNAVQGFTNEFADLVTRQAEDLRQRDIAIENADITNKATKFYLEQKDAYEQGIAKANSISEVTDLSKQYNDSMGNNLRQSIGVDKIRHPEVRTHAEEIIGRVSNQFLDHSSVALSKVRSSFADKAVGESVANALNIVRSGGSPEDAIQTVEENIKSLHNTGSIDLDKATDMTVKAQQQVIGDYMEYLSVNDPKQYVEVVKSGKYKNIMSSAEWKAVNKESKTIQDRELGAIAFQATLDEAASNPDVQAGKISQMDKANEIWMNPDTIKKHGLTDNQWREGMLNFKHALDFRNEQDEQAVSKETVMLSEKYAKHQLTLSDIQNTFKNVQDPKLKAKFIEHWTGLLISEAAQLRTLKAFELSAASAARSAKAQEEANNRFNKDVPEVKARLTQKINENPKAPGLRNEISSSLVSGIGTDTYNKMMGQLDKATKSKSVWATPKGKELYKVMNEARKNNNFSTNDDDNTQRYLETLEYAEDILEKNPDIDVQKLNNDINAKIKTYKKGIISKIISGHYGNAIYDRVNNE